MKSRKQTREIDSFADQLIEAAKHAEEMRKPVDKDEWMKSVSRRLRRGIVTGCFGGASKNLPSLNLDGIAFYTDLICSEGEFNGQKASDVKALYRQIEFLVASCVRHAVSLCLEEVHRPDRRDVYKEALMEWMEEVSRLVRKLEGHYRTKRERLVLFKRAKGIVKKTGAKKVHALALANDELLTENSPSAVERDDIYSGSALDRSFRRFLKYGDEDA